MSARLPHDHPALRHRLRLEAPAAASIAGLPLANGLLGASIWGDAAGLIVSLDRTDVWDLRSIPEFEGAEYSQTHLAAWVEAEDMAAIAARFEAPYKRPAPTKLPIGRIRIDAGGGACSLDLADAEAAVDAGGRTLSIGVDAVRKVGWIMAEGALPPLRVEPPRFGAEPGSLPTGPLAAISVGGPEDLGYPPPVVIAAPNASGYLQDLPDGRAVCVLLTWRASEALWTVALGDGRAAARALAEAELDAAHATPRAERLAAHRAWWAGEWLRGWLAAPDPVIERQWTLDAYKLIAAARPDAPPVALQGPWTSDDGRLPPWKGDYHHDLNTQMTYWPCLTGNRSAAHRAFLDWLWDTRDACRDWTARFFGCAGLNVPMTADLLNRQIGGWAPYTHSASTGAWLAAHFVAEAEVSGDAAFLRDRAAPYLFEACDFIEAVTAARGPHGERRLVLSSSPEIHNNARAAWFDGWTNYDLALFRHALAHAERFARTLGDATLAARWAAVAADLPDLARDEDGGLSVAPGHALDESHRHFSHLVAFHPLGLLSPDDPAFAPSMARLERLGTRNWMGYSFAWMAGLHALAGDGEACATRLRQFARGFTGANSFHTNGEVGGEGLTAWPFNAFTLEGNCGAMAAVQDMMLQSRDGVVRVFPALPASWRRAAFHGLAAVGGMRVSAELDAPSVVVRLEGTPQSYLTVRIGPGADVERVMLDARGQAQLERIWTGPR